MISAEQPIRIGIIGLGHIGRYHVEALRQNDALRLVSACDLDSALRSLLSDHVRFHTVDDELLAAPDIDTVIIATPNQTHFALAQKALAAGRNVIVEKPAATSRREFLELTETAATGGVHLYFAFHAARAFDVAWFTDYVADPEVGDRLGPLTAFACHFYDPYVEAGSIKKEAIGLENCWLDSGVNALSVLAEILDLTELTTVSTTATRNARDGTPIQCLVQYRFPTLDSKVGGIGTISTNWTLDLNQKQTWLGFGKTSHQILLDHSGQRVVEWGPGRDSVVLRDFAPTGDRLLNHYMGVFRDYVACVGNGVFNGERARQIHEQLFSAAP